MADARLELAGEAGGSGGRGPVPSPLPPDDPEAWYAPDVQAQYEVHPGVVVTITERDADFTYEVREPVFTAGDRAALERVENHFADAHLKRPRTREGTVEVMGGGFDPKRERTIDRLYYLPAAATSSA